MKSFVLASNACPRNNNQKLGSTAILLALVLEVFLFVLVHANAQETANDCFVECLKVNRQCVFSDNGDGGGSVAICGPCVTGYVEFGKRVGMNTEATCVDIASIQWEQFLEHYEPIYKNELSVEQRLELLIEAANFINQHNQNTSSSFQLGLTKYSVDAPQDYEQRSGYFYVEGIDQDEKVEYYQPQNMARADVPRSVDWVERGGVTSVKDQGRCGSCWAVSLCGMIEGKTFQQHGYLQSLSFQQLVSCNDQNLGCDGGNLVIASLYAALNTFGGLSRLNDYEYTDYRGETTQECYVNDESTPVAVTVQETAIVAGMSNSQLSFQERSDIFKQVLNDQPIAMVIKSSCQTLSNYRKGVVTDDGDCACGTPECLDHAVLMVGYDDDADIPYFKLKNSWGTGWGEDGYIRVAQTPKDPYGLFGMLAEGTIVMQALNVTSQVEDKEQDVPFPLWAILVIVAGSLLVLCIFGYCIIRRKKRNANQADKEEF